MYFFGGGAMANEFGAALRDARRLAQMSQTALAAAVGITQGAVSHLEVGRSGVEQSPDLVARLERALALPAGSLARHLPADHPARRMAAVELPVLGVVAAGAGRDDQAEPGEVLRVSEMWAGCVAYRVRGDSMTGERIRDGDYLIVRPAADSTPAPGSVVVAWIDGQGHACERLDARGYLRSSGRDRWAHRLTESDTVLGTLAGLVRIWG